MTKSEVKTASAAVQDILLSNPEGLHEVIRAGMQEVLEAEMEEALGAEKASAHRSGWATVRVATAAPLSRTCASWNCGFRRTGRGASRPSCSSATSVPAGAGCDAGADVCAGRVDAQGQGDHGRAVRPPRLGHY